MTIARSIVTLSAFFLVLPRLSSISRCGSILAQDDQIRGVTLTAEDNYCFNGSRLVVVGTGSDSIGKFAEYRTAVDSRTKILGYGATAADGFDVTHFVALCTEWNHCDFREEPESTRHVARLDKDVEHRARNGSSRQYHLVLDR